MTPAARVIALVTDDSALSPTEVADTADEHAHRAAWRLTADED